MKVVNAEPENAQHQDYLRVLKIQKFLEAHQQIPRDFSKQISDILENDSVLLALQNGPLGYLIHGKEEDTRYHKIKDIFVPKNKRSLGVESLLITAFKEIEVPGYFIVHPDDTSNLSGNFFKRMGFRDREIRTLKGYPVLQYSSAFGHEVK